MHRIRPASGPGSSLALATVLLLASALPMAAQWSTVAQIPPAGRYDDVFFLDAQNGWTVNSEGFVYHTTDGGTLWDPMAFLPSYLRCVEFISPLEGFCGGLNGTFYHTNDGGANWTDIAPNIQPTIEGICGLSAPTPDVIYGCGIWSSPAYVIRSTDGGNTWDHIDLSLQASALVDIHFLSADTGFVSGKGPGPDEEGIILYTTDGGQNWTEVYSTGVPYEYVWKLQSPDSGAHLFASIQANPNQGDTRFVRSLDRGASWTDTIISNLYYYVQAIGFLTPQLGWTGGDNALLETTDGGTTWDPIYIGQGYNRFFRINDSTAFLTGQRLYHYTTDLPTAMAEPLPTLEAHTFTATPTLTAGPLTIAVDLLQDTWMKVYVLGADGRLLRTLYDARATTGAHRFDTDLSALPAQPLVILLHTNHGQQVVRVVLK
ncbi:MAG: photosystem II stability/assembly factor-like protein [Flavobacteriales bacterium]|nr:photosystem II stability/assembly factor-like protein [Flavobacteriales bacterium]MBK9074879.1 photosystem II stability/assembly factor-like protein [Flavobacteriales bacterium]